MTARQVHAVLAAGAQNPHLIAGWQANPRFLLSHGISPDSIDLSALWKFAGLTVKVRHNGLRREFPLTFRLMSTSGEEIEFFASYAAHCAAHHQQLPSGSEERAAQLGAFLAQWLAPDNPTHALLWDMFRHESAIATLFRQASSPPSSLLPSNFAAEPDVPSPPAPSGSSVPTIEGDIVLHQMRCDPRMVESALFKKPPSVTGVPLGAHFFAYWRSRRTAEMLVLELDEPGYYALSLVDGARSLGVIHRALGGDERPSIGFLNSITHLAALGILSY